MIVTAAAGERRAARPLPVRDHAYFLVTLAGSVRAASDSKSTGGMIDTKTSLSYRWRETLAETVSLSTGKALARSPGATGRGAVHIDVVDSRTYGENHSLSCEMGLVADERRARAKEPLRLSLDQATGVATADGLMPFDLVNAVYDGPAQLNGLVPPCFSARPYRWMAALAIPLQEDPQLPPFRRLSCPVRRVGSSCREPFSYAMTWPSSTGESSLELSATLVAKRLARPAPGVGARRRALSPPP